jgi:hypothetical protein
MVMGIRRTRAIAVGAGLRWGESAHHASADVISRAREADQPCDLHDVMDGTALLCRALTHAESALVGCACLVMCASAQPTAGNRRERFITW